MISVCMATYNGEKFIVTQLESILNQTIKPDEVIICDDNSSDSTVDLIIQFIKSNKLGDNWKLIINEENKGYPGNFYYASSLCSNDLIFFADQDDYWVDNKIEVMLGFLEKQPNIQLVACAHGLIDQFNNTVEPLFHKKSRNDQSISYPNVKSIVFEYEIPGMAMAVRRDYIRTVSTNFDLSKIPHDFALAIKAADDNCFAFIDFIGVYHRRHGQNAAEEQHEVKELIKYERKLKALGYYILMLENVEKSQLLSIGGARILHSKLTFSKIRLKQLGNRNLFSIIKLYILNLYFFRIKSFTSDIISLIIK